MRHIHVLAAVVMALLAWQIAVGATDIYGNEIKVVDGVTYQYLVSGDPEAAATEKSSPLQSVGVSFATGTISTPTSAISVEARYRTWLESEGTDVDSTKFYGSVIIVF
jgi:hypothetical protein